MDRYRPENMRNAAVLLDKDVTLSKSYSVLRAGFPVYKSLTPGQGSEMCCIPSEKSALLTDYL